MPRFVTLSLAATLVVAAALPGPLPAAAAPARAAIAPLSRGAGTVFHVRTHGERAARGAGATAVAGGRFAAPAGAMAVPDGAGGTYVSWESDRDGPHDIYLLRVTAAGTVASGWPASGLAVCTAPGEQLEAGLLPDGSGGVLIGWADLRDQPYNLYSQTADLYVQRVNAAGVPQWTANGVKVLSDFNGGGDLAAIGDGSGGAFLVWAVSDPTDDGNIFAGHVDGAGAVPAGWSTAGVAVCTDPNGQYSPMVAADGSGGCYVVWQDDRGVSNEIYGQHLNGSAAVQWTADGVSLTGGNAGYTPSICTDGAGGFIAFWNTATAILGQHFDATPAEQWTAGGATVATGVSAVTEVMALPDPAGGAYLMWRDISGLNTVLRAQRVDGSGAPQWTSGGVSVCAATGDRYVEDAFAENGGGLALLWEDERSGMHTDLYAQRVDGSGAPQWTADGVALNTLDEDKRVSSLATDGAGGLVATWIDYRAVDPEPYAQHVNSSGVAQLGANGTAAYQDPGEQRVPIVVPDGAGGTWIAWDQKVAGVYKVYAKRLDSNGAALTGSIALSGAAGDEFLSGMVSDGADGVVIGWEDDRNGLNTDLYAQRLNGSGAPQWTANGAVVCTSNNDQFDLQLVGDGSGTTYFAWTDFRGGPEPDIYAQKLDASGVAQWAANGVGVCTSAYTQTGPMMAMSGTDGPIIAWRDNRLGFTLAVFAQRLDGAGAAQWAANGVQIAALAGLVGRLDGAVSDGSTGAIFLYEDEVFDFATLTFSTTNLGVQRVYADGNPQWGAAGTVLASMDAYRERARLVTDTAGGAIVAWCDTRNGINDIYAQRVGYDGVPLWTADGVVVCNDAAWQWLSGLASDGGGGAIATWTDERNGYADVYAQVLNGIGTPQWAANGVQVVGAARGQYESSVWYDDNTGESVIAWTDFRDATRRLIFAQKLNGGSAAQWGADGVTSTLYSMVNAEALPGRVRVTWQVSGVTDVVAYRKVEDGTWQSLGPLAVDGLGRVTIEDQDIVAGERYAYRIGMQVDGAEAFSDEVWIEVPNTLALAIEGVRPQPARRDAWMTFTLPSSAPARMEVMDVSGRRVAARDLAGFGAGRHVVRLDELPEAAGVYFVRVWQGGASVQARVVRVR